MTSAAFSDALRGGRLARRDRHATGVGRERRLFPPMVGRRITPLTRIGIDAGILVDAPFGAFDFGSGQIIALLLPRRLIASIK